MSISLSLSTKNIINLLADPIKITCSNEENNFFLEVQYEKNINAIEEILNKIVIKPDKEKKQNNI